MIMLKMSLLTSSLIICVTILTSIRFFLIFCFQIPAGAGLGPVSIKFPIFFSTSMALVKSDHLGQLLKPVNFLHQKPVEVISFFLVILARFLCVCLDGSCPG